MSALDGTVNLPKIGAVKKKTLLLIGIPFAGFVGWRWWQARNGAADYTETEPEDAGFEDPGMLPSVSGAVSDDNSYGLPDGGNANTGGSIDDYGFHGTTNAQWTQYATTQLVASDVWSYTDIVTALGAFLDDQPLSATQIQIVQAAIAVAGYPPVGNHTIIPVTQTPVSLPAPTGFKASNVGQTSCTLTWNAVSGASKYTLSRDGVHFENSADLKSTPTGMKAGTSYTFTVAAVGMDGKEGSKATLTVKTATAPSEPSKPTTSNKYPKRRLYYKAVRNDNYSKVASKYKTGLTGVQLYNYQFTKEAARSAAAIAELKKRGPNLIYAGTTIAVPYPK